MTEVAANYQMTDVTANCQLNEVAKNYMKEFQSAESDAILKQAGENKFVPDDWKPVNPSDPYIIEIGKFAVDEHNKKAHKDLVYISVVAGLMKLGPIGAGALYWLIISARDGLKGIPALGYYKALVKVPLEGSKQLKDFSPIFPFSTKKE